jgi:hypothetical protein
MEPGSCDLFTAAEDPELQPGWLWREERTPGGWVIRETAFTVNGYTSVDIYGPGGELVWRGARR